MLPRCLFKHTNEPISTTPTVVNLGEIDVDDNQDGARKRQKVNEDNEKPRSTTPNADSEKAAASNAAASNATVPSRGLPKPTDTKSGAEEAARKRLHAATRDVSPPPLRQKVQTGNPTPVRETHVQSSGIPSAPITPKVTPKMPVKAPLKQESLNPRLLKGAQPASYDMRYKLLKALHDQFSRLNSELAKDASDVEEQLVLSDQALITKALDIETEAAGTPAIYSNMVKNKIMLYKRMNVKQWVEEREKEVAKAKAIEAASISDTRVSKPTEPPKPIETGLSPDEELSLLPRLYTPITGLSKHGYVTSIPTDKEIELAKQGVEAAKGWEVCDRCKSRFQVFPGRREEDGALASGGPCKYHFGKPYWQDRSATDPKAKREKRYRCCNEAMGDSPGCTTAENHVFKISEVKRLAAVLNFENTPENLKKVSDRPVCIDCEMGYTVYGLELIRLTATSWPSGEELLDVLVRPVGPILDLNSRYSGVWPKDMAHALPWSSDSAKEKDSKQKFRIVDSTAAARASLFSHLSPLTPLIGHGLENDLNATRIIHPIIIDTALLFPHKAGLPYRNGLKALMQTHLNRHIQVVVDGKMEGHDSREDANAAGDLVRFALGKEWAKMRREGWVLRDGVFKPPTPQGPGDNWWLGKPKEPVKILSAATGSKRTLDEVDDGAEKTGNEELNYG
jgi:RNA exonuclease 1